MFFTFVDRNESDDFLQYSVEKPFESYKHSFIAELISSLSDSTIMPKIMLDYHALEEDIKSRIRTFKRITPDKSMQREKEQDKEKRKGNFLFSLFDGSMTERMRKQSKTQERYISMRKFYFDYVHEDLSKHDEFFSRNKKWMSPLTSVKILKTSIPGLHQNLTCEKIASYKDDFLDNLRLHLWSPGKLWTWKKRLIKNSPFIQSRLPPVLKEINDLRAEKYSPFEPHDLIQLVKIILRKRSRFDYLDVLSFQDDYSLLQSVYRYDFYWSLQSMGRQKHLKMAGRDQVKMLVEELKEGVKAAWERNKAKEN